LKLTNKEWLAKIPVLHPTKAQQLKTHLVNLGLTQMTSLMSLIEMTEKWAAVFCMHVAQDPLTKI